jgi:hypothetical protein
LTAVLLTVLVAVAGSSPGSWVAHPDGRIGPFRIDATSEAQIRVLLGNPLEVEKNFWPGKRGVYGRTLTYRCGAQAHDAVLGQRTHRQTLRLLVAVAAVPHTVYYEGLC